jgi:hypothetical protein
LLGRHWSIVPLSLDTSFALRSDAAARARDAQPNDASAAQRQRFAGALARVQAAEQAGQTERAALADRAALVDRAAAPTSAPTLVRAARTRLSGDEAAGALRAAWTQVRGEAPSPEALSILVGQWAHETGRGASMLNYNFGGLKGTGPSGLSAAYSTREGWGENAVRVVDRFRAYGSAEEGAHDYVSLLARRYPDALGAAENGDAKGFVQALKAGGYFTDNEAAYARSVQSLASLALRSGFEALGAGAGELDADSSLTLALEETPAGADVDRIQSAPLSPFDGGARPERVDASLAGFAPLAVPPAAFADEVDRAALLMSALRIAEPRSRDS